MQLTISCPKSSISCSWKPLPPPRYPDIVHKDDFKRIQEDSRVGEFSQDTGSTSGVYDYPDGVVPKDDSVTPEILFLRSGKADKAEVDALLKSEKQKAKNQVSDKIKEFEEHEKTRLVEERQAHLDNLTGFTPSNN